MAAEEKSGSPLPLQSLTVLLLLLSSTFLVSQIPFQVTRPADTGKLRHDFVSDQRVDARLWQDPLQAVQQFDSEELKSDRKVACGSQPPLDVHSVEYFRCRFRANFELYGPSNAPASDERSPVVLGVMIPGGPFAGAGETRRRTRYAVASALSAEGFVPVDSERIGYVKPPAGTTLPRLVPFERFSRPTDQGIPFDVLILWLDDTAFQIRPLGTLLNLKQQLLGSDAAEMKLIGPSDSDGLREVIKEVAGLLKLGQRGNILRALSATEIYSPFATARWLFIIGDALSDGNVLDLIRPPSNSCAPVVRFFRVTVPDDELGPALRKELTLRHVDFSPGSMDRIVLISEWDTFYSRSLRTSVSAALGASAGECADWLACNVVHFRYLRGLDGAPAGKSTAAVKESARDKDKKGTPPAESIEWPEGPDLRDYLRRLTNDIRSTADRLREPCHPGRKCMTVRAIGILGNDVHDKILLLQALREHFPDAIFFTTDLDARLLHPTVFQWTRNLVVASGFGLTLRSEVQHEIPPFRDSYQTAGFLAVRMAIHNAGAEIAKNAGWQDIAPISTDVLGSWLERPRVYEVGRGRAYSQLAAVEMNGEGCEFPLRCADIHVQDTDLGLDLGGKIYCVLLAALALALLLYAYSWRARSGVIGLRSLVWPPLWAEMSIGRMFGVSAVAILIALSGTMLWEIVWNGPATGRGEAFAWFGGVSVWPSLVIRLLAIALCACFLARAWGGIRANEKKLTAAYFPELDERRAQSTREKPSPARVAGARDDCPGSKLPGPKRCLEIVRAAPAMLALLTALAIYLLKRTSIYHWRGRSLIASRDSQLITHGARLWEEYLERGSGVRRVARVAIASIVFLIFSLAVIDYYCFPTSPVRGDIPLRLVNATLIFLVPMFVILLVTVADATRLCTQLIDNLMRAQTEYPPSTYAAFRAELQLRKEIPDSCMDDWIDIRLIAERTEFIGGLIYYPFIILALLIVARSRIFDNWDLHHGLLIVFAASLIFSVSLAVFLGRSADKARKIAIERMSDGIVRMQAAGPESAPARAQLQELLDRVRGMKQGAFLPFFQQPLVRATLVPLSGLGGIQFLEYFLWSPR